MRCTWRIKGVPTAIKCVAISMCDNETLIGRIVYLLKRAKIQKPSHLTHAFTFGITFDLFDDVFDVFD